jgi:hypothetical protein
MRKHVRCLRLEDETSVVVTGELREGYMDVGVYVCRVVSSNCLAGLNGSV